VRIQRNRSYDQTIGRPKARASREVREGPLFAVLLSISRDRVPGSSPTIATGIFSPRSLLSSTQKVSRCGLKMFPPEVYTASFGGDVKPSVPGELV